MVCGDFSAWCAQLENGGMGTKTPGLPEGSTAFPWHRMSLDSSDFWWSLYLRKQNMDKRKKEKEQKRVRKSEQVRATTGERDGERGQIKARQNKEGKEGKREGEKEREKEEGKERGMQVGREERKERGEERREREEYENT